MRNGTTEKMMAALGVVQFALHFYGSLALLEYLSVFHLSAFGSAKQASLRLFIYEFINASPALRMLLLGCWARSAYKIGCELWRGQRNSSIKRELVKLGIFCAAAVCALFATLEFDQMPRLCAPLVDLMIAVPARDSGIYFPDWRLHYVFGSVGLVAGVASAHPQKGSILVSSALLLVWPSRLNVLAESVPLIDPRSDIFHEMLWLVGPMLFLSVLALSSWPWICFRFKAQRAGRSNEELGSK